MLSIEAQAQLLALAKQALEDFLSDDPAASFDLSSLPVELIRPAAVFVTLRRGAALRGCIGNLDSVQPLAREVMRTAVASATEDPRFEPLTRKELPDLTLEISVLSPMHRVASPDQIVPGRHGVMLRWGGRRGLFLPQVWKETGWNRARFLDELCQGKSGLPASTWQDPQAELWVFEVDSFSAPVAEIPAARL